MRRVPGGDTGPEKQVRSLLHGLGYRFTVAGPLNRTLPGKPDIVLPRRRTVVFVHGCFWHAHAPCKRARIPEAHRDYWLKKIMGNKARDARAARQLRAAGWKVIVVWTCRLTSKAALERERSRLKRELARGCKQIEERR